MIKIEIYFNAKTMDEFSKIYSLTKSMDNVIDEQYILLLKRDKNSKKLVYIRAAITFLTLVERMMTENKNLCLYGKLKFEKSKDKYKEEIESKEAEMQRYPYLVNIIGKNAILDFEQQSIGVCLVYQTWYIEKKLTELNNYWGKSAELKSLKILLKSIVSAMKKYFVLWREDLEEFDREKVIEITEDLGPEIFHDEEFIKFKKIIDSKIEVYFKDEDEDQRKQKFYTGFYLWEYGELPYKLLVEEESENIGKVFENLKKLGILSGVYEPILKAPKGLEEIYRRIKLEASSISLNSIFGKGEYVFVIGGVETIETPHTDVLEAWEYFCKNSKIYNERKKAVLSKTAFFPQKLTIGEQEVKMGVAELYMASKNKIIEVIVAVIGDEYIETWTTDANAAINYVKLTSVMIFKKKEE